MAKPNTARGTKVRLLLGNGLDPETFEAMCGITAKTINFQTNTNETFVADCDNPDDPAWRELVKSGRFVSVSGEGVLDTLVLQTMMGHYNDNDAVNARLYIDVAAAKGGGYFLGAFMVTNLQIGGNDAELATVQIALESSGEVAWVPAT